MTVARANIDPPVDRIEFLLESLAELTPKVRELCRDHELSVYRAAALYSTAAVISLFLVTGATVIIYLAIAGPEILNRPTGPFEITFSLVMLALSLLVYWMSSIFRRSLPQVSQHTRKEKAAYLRQDISVYAKKLRALIQEASGHFEYGKVRDQTQRMKLEYRLLDAENALRYANILLGEDLDNSAATPPAEKKASRRRPTPEESDQPAHAPPVPLAQGPAPDIRA